MRNTLICTVGTSLFEGNLSRLSASTENCPDNWQAIKQAYEAKNWRKLAQELLTVNPTQRLCGAEINTIEEARKKSFLSLENLFFLVSDTPSGKNTGEFLKHYFSLRKDLDLRVLEYKVVDDLLDTDPKRFKIHGLRNLVRRIGDCIQRMGGPNYVILDATGGYKAQIAVAVIIGQALNIPVFYKHERFAEIIDFPPLPIAFDYAILADHADVLTDFERNATFSSHEITEIDEKLRVFVDEVHEDNESLYALNPIGQIYLTAFRLRYPKPIDPAPAAKRKEPTFGNDHHYPDGFKEFVQKVWQENNWINYIHSTSYAKQKGIKEIGFSVKSGQLMGTYKEDDFGMRFQIYLEDESLDVLAWAADTLNQKYREK